MTRFKFRPHDPVSFQTESSELQGYIATVKASTALVVLDDGREFRVPIELLKLRSDVKPRRVHTKNDEARMDFAEDDPVSFLDRDRVRRAGRIVKLNPKYARVRCGDQVWQVSYLSLLHELPDATRTTSNRSRFEEIEDEAELLIRKHELDGWRFGFDLAARRGGRCSFDRREISLSEKFALAAPPDEITDTILHEIAHALVGPKHGHDATWKTTARRIGCSGRVSHDIDFSSARWILTCPTCGWQVPRLRRRNGLICTGCGGRVEYHANDGSVSKSESR